MVMMSFAQRINAASAELRQLGGKFSDLNMQTPPQTQRDIEMLLVVNTNDMAILENWKAILHIYLRQFVKSEHKF